MKHLHRLIHLIRSVWRGLSAGLFTLHKILQSRFRINDSQRVVYVRLGVLFAALTVFIGAFLARYAYLAVFPTELRTKLVSMNKRQHSGKTTLSSPRAAILDRNDRPLALTTYKPSAFVVPMKIPDSRMKQVATVSGVSLSRLQKWKTSSRKFAWLRRQTTPKIIEKLQSIERWDEFGGILEEPARFYPAKGRAAQLIGFTGIDNLGLAGLEKVLDDRLKGESESFEVTRDARRRITITYPGEASKPKKIPQPVKLTIDLEVQRILEDSLEKAMESAKARAASGLVLDIETGELFASASLPTFDLNGPQKGSPDARRNRPFQDALEVGSVVKPLVVAAALNEGVIQAEESVDCEKGVLRLPGATIHDTKPNEILSIAEILRKSSNVCMYKIAKRLTRETLHSYLVRFGFESPSGLGFPGEYAGNPLNPKTWREIRFANIAFGQGIAVSPIQFARAFASSIGSGRLLKLQLLREDKSHQAIAGEQVVEPEIASILRSMLTEIVDGENPAAPRAQLEAFLAAGKTGTAEKFSTVTHSYSERIPNFVGYFPAQQPKFLIYILLDEAQVRPAWGGQLAAPVFSQVGNALARYLKARGELAIYPKRSRKSP